MSPPCWCGGVPPPSRSPGISAKRCPAVYLMYNGRVTVVYAFVRSPGHVYPDHPERPERLSELEARLGRWPHAERVDVVPATLEDVARVHSAGLIAALREASQREPGIIDFAPTYVTTTSFDDALLAAGGALTCARAVLSGEARGAFAIVRPPGHHAEPGRAMGFCLFNNVAIAAREALHRGMERVLIVDFDAHHGNGTQAVFRDDERVAYLSTHQEGIYPGTGRVEESPHARKRIVNLPLPPYAGDDAFAALAEEIITPLVEHFRPQMLFVSAGFDGHWRDPLTALGLSTAGYFVLARHLVALAEEHCQGRILFVLEGGYDPANVANGVMAGLAALRGDESFPSAGDAFPHAEPDIASRLSAVRRWHGWE